MTLHHVAMQFVASKGSAIPPSTGFICDARWHRGFGEIYSLERRERCGHKFGENGIH
jgi:hypothetical protein